MQPRQISALQHDDRDASLKAKKQRLAIVASIFQPPDGINFLDTRKINQIKRPVWAARRAHCVCVEGQHG